MNVVKIQAALSYVHHYEKEKTRVVAAKEAIKNLSPDETTILLNAIHVSPEEVK